VGAALLAAALPGLPHLSELHLSYNRIDSEGLSRILDSVPACPCLRKLTAKDQSWIPGSFPLLPYTTLKFESRSKLESEFKSPNVSSGRKGEGRNEGGGEVMSPTASPQAMLTAAAAAAADMASEVIERVMYSMNGVNRIQSSDDDSKIISKNNSTSITTTTDSNNDNFGMRYNVVSPSTIYDSAVALGLSGSLLDDHYPNYYSYYLPHCRGYMNEGLLAACTFSDASREGFGRGITNGLMGQDPSSPLVSRIFSPCQPISGSHCSPLSMKPPRLGGSGREGEAAAAAAAEDGEEHGEAHGETDGEEFFNDKLCYQRSQSQGISGRYSQGARCEFPFPVTSQVGSHCAPHPCATAQATQFPTHPRISVSVGGEGGPLDQDQDNLDEDPIFAEAVERAEGGSLKLTTSQGSLRGVDDYDAVASGNRDGHHHHADHPFHHPHQQCYELQQQQHQQPPQKIWNASHHNENNYNYKCPGNKPNFPNNCPVISRPHATDFPFTDFPDDLDPSTAVLTSRAAIVGRLDPVQNPRLTVPKMEGVTNGHFGSNPQGASSSALASLDPKDEACVQQAVRVLETFVRPATISERTVVRLLMTLGGEGEARWRRRGEREEGEGREEREEGEQKGEESKGIINKVNPSPIQQPSEANKQGSSPFPKTSCRNYVSMMPAVPISSPSALATTSPIISPPPPHKICLKELLAALAQQTGFSIQMIFSREESIGGPESEGEAGVGTGRISHRGVDLTNHHAGIPMAGTDNSQDSMSRNNGTATFPSSANLSNATTQITSSRTSKRIVPNATIRPNQSCLQNLRHEFILVRPSTSSSLHSLGTLGEKGEGICQREDASPMLHSMGSHIGNHVENHFSHNVNNNIESCSTRHLYLASPLQKEVVVDPHFRDQFVISQPTPR